MVCLLILAVISVNSAGTFRLEDVLRNMNNIAQSSNDEGKVVNCGNSTMSSFTANWSPKDIKYGETVTINGNFESASIFASGKACYKVWVIGIPDPVVDSCSHFTCADLQGIVSFFGMKVNCPIKKGDKYSVKDQKMKVQPSFQLPQGSYKAHGTVTLDDGTPYMCADFQVAIK